MRCIFFHWAVAVNEWGPPEEQCAYLMLMLAAPKVAMKKSCKRGKEERENEFFRSNAMALLSCTSTCARCPPTMRPVVLHRSIKGLFVASLLLPFFSMLWLLYSVKIRAFKIMKQATEARHYVSMRY